MGFGMSAAMLYHWRGISSSLSKIFTDMGISLLLFVVRLSLPCTQETKGHAHEWMSDRVRQSRRGFEAQAKYIRSGQYGNPCSHACDWTRGKKTPDAILLSN